MYIFLYLQVDVIVNIIFLDLDIVKGVVRRFILEVVGNSLKIELDDIFVIYKKGGKVMWVKYGEIKEIMGYCLKCRSIFYGFFYKWDGEGKVVFDVSMNILYVLKLIIRCFSYNIFKDVSF